MALVSKTLFDSLRLQTSEMLDLCKRALCDVETGVRDSISAVVLEERVMLSATPLAITATPLVDTVEEFQVNVTTADSQVTSAEDRGSQSAIAIDEDGNYVVVWSSANQDGSGWGVYARRFDATGSAITGEIQVAETTDDDQRWARVASDEDGNFVVVWTSSNQDGTPSSVYGRRFDSLGNALTGEFRVNTHTTGSQSNADIAMDEDGNFVVVWQGAGPSDADGIFARRYDDTATAIDMVEIRVNEFNVGVDQNPSVSIDEDGNFVVAWVSGGSVRARLFSEDGTATSGEFHVSGLSTAWQPDVVYHESGDFTVVWSSDGSLLSGIYLQRYDSVGNPIGILTPVELGKFEAPSIATDSDGNSIIVWQGPGDGDANGVFGRKLDVSGSLVGATFQINQQTVGDQHQASVAMIDSDNFVVVWSGQGIGDADGVFARQFGAAIVNQPPTANSGGRYTINQGDDLILDGSGSSDPNSDLLTYAWDLDNDGIFGGPSEPVGASPTISWATLQSLGIANLGDYAIGLQVDDGNGGVDIATTTLTINNVAPTINSSNSANVAENTTKVLTVTATDPVDTVTYSITGGSDQSHFQIDVMTGELTFIVAPDFELPTDSDGDNVYEVEVTADDNNGNTTVQQIRVSVNNVNEAPIFVGPAQINLLEDGPVEEFDWSNWFVDPDIESLTISIDHIADSWLSATIDPVSNLLGLASDADMWGTSSIVVRATDSSGSSTIANVVVNVVPVNDTVFAANQDIQSNITMPITGTLIDETVDVDGEALTVVVTQSPTSGQLEVNADGSFTFTPDDQFVGTASFRFVVNDGVAVSNEAVVTMTFAAAPVSTNTTPSITTVVPDSTTADEEAPETNGNPIIDTFKSEIVHAESETGTALDRPSGQYNNSTSTTAAPDPVDSVRQSPVVEVPDLTAEQYAPTAFHYANLPVIDFQSQIAGSVYESVQTVVASTTSAFSVIAHPGLLWNELDSLWSDAKSEQRISAFAVGSIGTVSSGLIVGYVIWALRSGLMLSSIVATMPAWNLLDPLAIIPIADQGVAGDAETLEDIVDSQQKKSVEPAPV